LRPGPLGLKAIAETIDNRTDFKLFMQNYVVARGGVPRGPRREGMYEDSYVRLASFVFLYVFLWPARTGTQILMATEPFVLLFSRQLPSIPPHVQQTQSLQSNPSSSSSHPNLNPYQPPSSTSLDNSSSSSQAITSSSSSASSAAEAYPTSAEGRGGGVFGVDLTEAMQRDGDEVPRILETCAKAIEERGLTTVGIYRLSGMKSAVQKLKDAFDRGSSLPLLTHISLCLYLSL
jgi:hypothetical protein